MENVPDVYVKLIPDAPKLKSVLNVTVPEELIFIASLNDPPAFCEIVEVAPMMLNVELPECVPLPVDMFPERLTADVVNWQLPKRVKDPELPTFNALAKLSIVPVTTMLEFQVIKLVVRVCAVFQ
jgi:hypothetical protein